MRRDITVGVLALQGAFAKHIAVLKHLGVKAIEVRKPEDLHACSALIIPGGESTTMRKQMDFIGLEQPLREFGLSKPVFGTCAGLILMSKEIFGEEYVPFGFLDITVERNAFGRQIESFVKPVPIVQQKQPFPAVFIRAPRIRTQTQDVEILSSLEGEAILVRQGMHLGATFHPELTQDTRIHKFFLSLIKD